MADPDFAGLLRALESPPFRPTTEWLNELMTRWLDRVAFENLSKLARLRAGVHGLPTTEEWAHRARDTGAGGTCFAQARGLHALLSHLGIDADVLAADTSDGPGSHALVGVHLDGSRYLLDPGFAGPFWAVVAPGRSAARVLGRFTYSFHQRPSGFAVEVRENRSLVSGYSGTWRPPAPGWMDEPVARSERPDARFVRMWRASRIRETTATDLRGYSLQTRSAGNHTQTTLPDAQAVEQALRDRLGLDRLLDAIGLPRPWDPPS